LSVARTQNLTVRLEETVIRQAKRLAAARGTSISQLVADKIREAVGENQAYERARRQAIALLEHGFPLAVPRHIPRDDLHARR
jgi:hypothetical protein